MNMKMMKAVMMGVALVVAMFMWPASCGRGYTFTPTPNERCRVETEYCTIWQSKICCTGFRCMSDSWSPIGGTCKRVRCIAAGRGCNLLTDPCCYPNVCSSFDGNGKCVKINHIAQVILPM